jgi:hypothetical protein
LHSLKFFEQRGHHQMLPASLYRPRSSTATSLLPVLESCAWVAAVTMWLLLSLLLLLQLRVVEKLLEIILLCACPSRFMPPNRSRQ